jgi:hypothetical protein
MTQIPQDADLYPPNPNAEKDLVDGLEAELILGGR